MNRTTPRIFGRASFGRWLAAAACVTGFVTCVSGQESEPIETARKLVSRGKRKEAWRVLDTAIERHAKRVDDHPGDAKALLALAHVRYERRPDAAAIALVDRVLEISPDDVDALVFRGWIHFENGQLDDARRRFDRAVDVAPSQPRPRFERARFLIAAERHDEADEALRSLLVDTPEFWEARIELAAKWFESNRRDEALDLLRGGVDLDQGNLELRDQYGQLLQIADRPGEAYEQYEFVLRAKPDHFRAACKVVQLATALDREDIANHVARVHELHEQGKSDTPWWCREQFQHAGKRVFVQEYFKPRGARPILWRFDVIDESSGGKTLCRIALASYDTECETARKANQIGPEERAYHVDQHDGTKVATYQRFLKTPPSYEDLKALVKEIVAGRREPLADGAPAR